MAVTRFLFWNLNRRQLRRAVADLAEEQDSQAFECADLAAKIALEEDRAECCVIRPELAERFDSNQVSIITSVGDLSLILDDGKPDSVNFSDHLPLVCEIEF